MAHLQFCAAGQDITGSVYDSQDATQVRAWRDNATCLGEVTREESGNWYASASDVITWPDFADEAYDGWRAALAALLAVGNLHGEIPEEEWRQ